MRDVEEREKIFAIDVLICDLLCCRAPNLPPGANPIAHLRMLQHTPSQRRGEKKNLLRRGWAPGREKSDANYGLLYLGMYGGLVLRRILVVLLLLRT